MNFFEKNVRKLAVLLYYAAGAAIVCMMLITTVDVLLRLAVTIYARTGWSRAGALQACCGNL